MAGTPVLGVACTSAMGTPATLPLDEQNLPVAESAAHHASNFEGERSTVCMASRACAIEDDLLHFENRRVSTDGEVSEIISPSIIPEELVTAGPHAVHAGAEQPAAAAILIPTEASLLLRARRMFLGGPGGPAASGGDESAAEVTKGLVLVAAEAIRELFSTERDAIQLACGVLDEREALAYLVGDAAGLGLITACSARKAGDKAGKLVWVAKGAPPIEKELADARRAVQRRAGKLREGTLESELAAARAAILRQAVALPLDKRLSMPPPKHSLAGRKRARPPEHDPEARFEAWCKRKGGSPSRFADHRRKEGERVWRLQEYQRAWNPQSWQWRRELEELRERDRWRNDMCTCGEGVPSWLCRVASCYSFEVVGDGGCDERSLPGCHECMCLDWPGGAALQPPPSWRRRHLHVDPFKVEAGGRYDPDPAPEGGWLPVEPFLTHAKWKVRFFAGEIDRWDQAEREERKGAAIRLRRSLGMPSAPVRFSMGEVLSVIRERPDAKERVKAIIAQQGVAEELKMARIQLVLCER